MDQHWPAWSPIGGGGRMDCEDGGRFPSTPHARPIAAGGCLWTTRRGMIEAQKTVETLAQEARKCAMSRVMLDPQLRSNLDGLNDQVEICDEAGKTLGRFLPESLYR